MNIIIVTPAASSARTGNRRTAMRYAAFLRGAGHRARIVTRWDGADCDLMIALHARKSHDSIRRYREAFPARPLVLVLTGTDVYRDIATDADARQSLEDATRLVVLQEDALRQLPRRLRARTRVVVQSAEIAPSHPKPRRVFRACVIGHLREEKDPFRAAAALEHIDAALPIELVHLGDALAADMAGEANAWMRRDSRYRWLGGVPHARALSWLARSHLLIVSSRMEGGANVICEAALAGTPVLASRISGNIGMLGRDYPGYFRTGDERALARLLLRAQRDPAFYRALARALRRRRSLFLPTSERHGLLRVVDEAKRAAGYSNSRPAARTARTGAKLRR